ncbi:multidrug efflux SMR transporter [Thalassobacillus sp. CUG 92003]|uniref:DMT family transporter n=1 Tax=Thalassobacillus sp. CUG 92003 TaxID=2736641 RepID=UPI0015E7E1C9|nr:multidrug efflux SMR transporter [Thalassobacillus sp. CUG 92003]
MGFILLGLTVIFGIIGNFFVKLSEGFARPLYTCLTFITYGFVTYLLSVTVQYIEVGIVYAVWSGATIAFTTLLGIVFFEESRHIQKYSSIALIILGVVCLNMASILTS